MSDAMGAFKRGEAGEGSSASASAGPVPGSPDLSGVHGGPNPGASRGFLSRGGGAPGLGIQRGAFEREEELSEQKVGRSVPKLDKRKYRYDALRGQSAIARIEVSRDDRMSAEEAGERLHAIHVMFGVERLQPGQLAAFDEALWVCHTVNGASVLNPGRSKFSIEGSVEFEYTEVVKMLGADLRRFFRSFADDIAAANKRALSAYDPNDPVKTELWGWIMAVAMDRGLVRFPYLAHDSAEACTGLTLPERAALAQSKAMVVSSGVNTADKVHSNARVAGLDRYDATTGQTY